LYRLRSRGGLGSCASPNNLSEAKAQWCLTFPALCSTATIQAATALCSPELVISPILQPPPHPAVGAGLSPIPAPYPCSDGSLATAATNCPEYSAAIDASIADQQRSWQAQNAATMAQTQANLDQINAANPPFCLLGTATQAADGSWACPSGLPSIPTWAWFALAGVAAFAMVSAGGGSPRRYGR
jgi:hypothetical protein